MLSRLLTGLCLLIACFQLAACEDCGVREEPLLSLNIGAGKPFRVDTIYGADATGKLLQDTKQPTPNQFFYYQLPLNLNADSTRYVLSIDGKQEAITVFYKRNFYYKSRQCGYVVDLQSAGVQKQQARTTRGRIGSVVYRQNSFDGRFLRPSTPTGIQLAISL